MFGIMNLGMINVTPTFFDEDEFEPFRKTFAIFLVKTRLGHMPDMILSQLIAVYNTFLEA